MVTTLRVFVLVGVAACSSSNSSESSGETRTLEAGTHTCTQQQFSDALICESPPPSTRCTGDQKAEWGFGIKSPIEFPDAGLSQDEIVWAICVSCIAPSANGGPQYDCVPIRCTTDQACKFGASCKNGYCL